MCALALVIAALVPAQAQQDREAALGAQMAAQLRERMPVVNDTGTRFYVSELVTKLAGRDYPITLEIVDTHSSDEPTEPLWLIGHYVFIPTALIRDVRDESELAGMLAHTLAHESRRDWIRVENSVTMRLYMIGSEGPVPMQIPLGFRRDPRVEYDADAGAVKAMQKAGYDPAALLRYVSRLHASDTNRIEALGNVIQEMPAASPAVLDTSGFQRIQQKYRPADLR